MVKDIIVKVEDMKCIGCEGTIRKRLLTLKGVHDARADFKTGRVLLSVDSDFEGSEVTKAIRELGYTPEKYEE